jgi:PKD repeat protein
MGSNAKRNSSDSGCTQGINRFGWGRAMRRTHRKLCRAARCALLEPLEGRTLLSAAGDTIAGPDPYGYTASTTVPPAVVLDPQDANTLITGFDNKASGIDLGSNTFTFYGHSYTGPELFASTNGLITFDTPVAQSDHNADLSVAAGPLDPTPPTAASIAPLWDDWVTTVPGSIPRSENGQVLWQFEGIHDGKADKLVLQWNEVHHFFFSPESVTFQAVLSLNAHGDDNIVFNYIDLTSGDEADNGATAAVGIKDAGAAAPRLIVSVDHTNPAVAAGQAILISHATNQPPVAATPSVSSTAVDEGGAVSICGDFSDADTLDSHTVTVDFGDKSNPVIATVDEATKTYFASHTYVDDPGTADNTFAITATVQDNHGGSGSANTTVIVHNVAPTISNLTTTVDPVAVNSGIALASAEFTDPGVLDTHNATWDWGDGKTSDATLAEPGAGHNGAVGGAHTYAAPGTYTVRLTVRDDDGGEQTLASKSFVVVYDPTAGFVTGGGWIDSPAGANVNNPTAVGKGRFGFVSKYQNGTNIPTGQTQFTLNVANLNFHSTAYDWMVVTGGRADYHGAGTMNGLAGYHFQLTAIDGGSTADGIDRVRLRIWCDATGSLVYDNGLGALDDNGPGTALAGGSIVVHG